MKTTKHLGRELEKLAITFNSMPESPLDGDTLEMYQQIVMANALISDTLDDMEEVHEREVDRKTEKDPKTS